MINDKETFIDRMFLVNCGMLWKLMKLKWFYGQNDFKREYDILTKIK